MAEDKDSASAKRLDEEPSDLVKEREQFVRTFLKKGVEFTEELVHENYELRSEIVRLRGENTRLRTQIASDDAIRDLVKTIERLEEEKNDLLTRSDELERSHRRDERRYAEVENELNDLANLYIASHQLHASLSVGRVVRQLCDMLGQLVGAQRFVIYILEADSEQATPLASEGLGDGEVGPVSASEGPVGDAILTKMPNIQQRTPLGEGSHEAPLAVIPMVADDHAVGAISILSVLEQKAQWASVDEELFKLLGKQAGTALIGANLYAATSDPLAALSGVKERL
ncbi:MAG: GAF domain-containing protein [Polyangiales bacterium]